MPDKVDSLPRENTRINRRKRSIHQDQRDALCENGIHACAQESNKGGSDSDILCHTLSPAMLNTVENRIPSFKSAAYQGSYLARGDALEDRSDPMLLYQCC